MKSIKDLIDEVNDCSDPRAKRLFDLFIGEKLPDDPDYLESSVFAPFREFRDDRGKEIIQAASMELIERGRHDVVLQILFTQLEAMGSTSLTRAFLMRKWADKTGAPCPGFDDAEEWIVWVEMYNFERAREVAAWISAILNFPSVKGLLLDDLARVLANASPRKHSELFGFLRLIGAHQDLRKDSYLRLHEGVSLKKLAPDARPGAPNSDDKYPTIDKESLAIAHLSKNPGLTDEEISSAVGVHRSTLGRWHKYKKVKALLKNSNAQRFKRDKTGDI